jgi:hypothetical protein
MCGRQRWKTTSLKYRRQDYYCRVVIDGMISSNCNEEIIMSTLLSRIERRARLLMAALTFLTLVILMLFKMHLIQFQPSFDAYGWYTVDAVNTGLTVTRRVPSETVCRAQARLHQVSCLQGKSLNAQLLASNDVH